MRTARGVGMSRPGRRHGAGPVRRHGAGPGPRHLAGRWRQVLAAAGLALATAAAAPTPSLATDGCEGSPAAAAGAALAAAAAPWELPVVVRAALDACDAPAIMAASELAARVLADVGATATALPEADVRTGLLQSLFEAAATNADLEALAIVASRQRQAAGLVASARAEIGEPRPAVVALGIAPAKLEAEQATAIAAVAVADLDGAQAAVAFIERELDDEAEAARLVIAARDRVAAPRAMVEAFGLAGTDFGPRLHLAVAAVQGINLPSARALAESVEGDLDRAWGVGLARAVAAMAALAVGAFVLIRLRLATR